MRRIILLLLLVATAGVGFCRTPDARLDAAIERLKSEDWFEVEKAAHELQSIGAPAVPRLLELMDDDQVRPVSPVSICSGHPGFDLDPLARRAGWVLSNLVFQNFRAWDKQQDPQAAAARARQWWAAQAPSWQRLDGLEAALKGHGLTYLALDFLHNGRYWGEFCEGLTRRAYFDRILPLVVKLQESEDLEIRDRAQGLPMVEYPRRELTINGVTPANSEHEVKAAGAQWHRHPFNPRVTGQQLYLDGQLIAALGDPVERISAHLGPGDDGYYKVWPFELHVSEEKGVIAELTLIQPYVPWYDN